MFYHLIFIKFFIVDLIHKGINKNNNELKLLLPIFHRQRHYIAGDYNQFGQNIKICVGKKAKRI